jgi:hypothetical protein
MLFIECLLSHFVTLTRLYTLFVDVFNWHQTNVDRSITMRRVAHANLSIWMELWQFDHRHQPVSINMMHIVLSVVS